MKKNLLLSIATMMVVNLAIASEKEKPTCRDMSTAAFQGKIESIIELFAAGVSVNCKENSFESAPLHYAAAGRHAETVEVLLALGANSNQVNSLDASPLHYISHSCHAATGKALFKTAEALLKSGANHSLEADYYNKPLDRIRNECPSAIVKEMEALFEKHTHKKAGWFDFLHKS